MHQENKEINNQENRFNLLIINRLRFCFELFLVRRFLKITSLLACFIPFSIQAQELAPITNFTLTKNGKEIELTWDARAQVDADGFYQIKRADNTFYKIAGDVTSFSQILDIQGSINYSMIYCTTELCSPRAFVPPVYHLNEGLLFYEYFYIEVIDNIQPTYPFFVHEGLSDFSHKWTVEQEGLEPNWSTFLVVDYFERNGSGHMYYQNTSTTNDSSISRLISPVINTSGFTEITLDFFVKSGTLTQQTGDFALETSSDGGFTWQTINSWDFQTDKEEIISTIIANSDVGSTNFQFSLVARGDAYYTVVFDNFVLAGEPIVNLKVKEPNLPEMITPETPFNLVGLVENIGADITDVPVTLEIVDRINNQIVWTETITLSSLEAKEEMAVNFSPWNAVEGEYIIKVTVEKEKDIALDNNIFTQDLEVLYPMEKDLVLVENFTSTICPECASLATINQLLLEMDTKVAFIDFHKFDDYETSISEDRSWLYAASIFPTSYIDGQKAVIGGSGNYLPMEDYLAPIQQANNRSTPVAIQFSNNTIEDGLYETAITVESLSPIQSDNYRLFVALVENDLAALWMSETPISQIPLVFETYDLTLTNKKAEVSFTVEIPENTNQDNLELIAFVQLANNRKVWNTSKIALAPKSNLSTAVTDWTATNVEVYPNPTKGILQLENVANFEQYQLFNAFGQLVIQEPLLSNRINMDVLPAGIYFLKLASGFPLKSYYKKIIKN